MGAQSLYDPGLLLAQNAEKVARRPAQDSLELKSDFATYSAASRFEVCYGALPDVGLIRQLLLRKVVFLPGSLQAQPHFFCDSVCHGLRSF